MSGWGWLAVLGVVWVALAGACFWWVTGGARLLAEDRAVARRRRRRGR